MTVAYDPRTKKRIRQELHEELYGPINRELENELASIIRKNSIACGNDQQCFKYKGEVYAQNTIKLIPRPVNWLKPQFFTDMESYLDEKNTLEKDELPYVIGYINQVLNSSDSFQDYYKLFPDSIHHVLKRIQAQCPCRNDTLKLEQIDRIQRQNIHSVNLMRKRLTINVLLAG